MKSNSITHEMIEFIRNSFRQTDVVDIYDPVMQRVEHLIQGL